jgi:hypothetical protein
MSDPVIVQIDDVQRPATPAELEVIDTVQQFMAEQPLIGSAE